MPKIQGLTDDFVELHVLAEQDQHGMKDRFRRDFGVEQGVKDIAELVRGVGDGESDCLFDPYEDDAEDED